MVYIAGSLSYESALLLEHLFKNVPNVLDKGYFHISYLSSLDKVDFSFDKNINHVATIDKLAVWKTKDKKNCLVLIVKSDEITKYHQSILEHGVKDMYPNFIPHISISYDIGDFDYRTLKLVKDDLLIDLLYKLQLSHKNGSYALTWNRDYKN